MGTATVTPWIKWWATTTSHAMWTSLPCDTPRRVTTCTCTITRTAAKAIRGPVGLECCMATRSISYLESHWTRISATRKRSASSADAWCGTGVTLPDRGECVIDGTFQSRDWFTFTFSSPALQILVTALIFPNGRNTHQPTDSIWNWPQTQARSDAGQGCVNVHSGRSTCHRSWQRQVRNYIMED